MTSTDFTPCVQQDLQMMCRHYGPLMTSLHGVAVLQNIKDQTRATHFIRIHQSAEYWPTVMECLKFRSLPKGITDCIFAYVDTVGKRTFNPLMICTWQSDVCASTRSRLVGSPPCAIEFLDGCDQHRDDIKTDTLSPREQLSYKINTVFIDEIWQDQIIYPTLQQLSEWVTLFSALCYDNDGNYFIYVFFFSTFSERESMDHIIEFGWRMNVNPSKAIEIIRWMKSHNIEFNLKTGEVSMERFDVG